MRHNLENNLMTIVYDDSTAPALWFNWQARLMYCLAAFKGRHTFPYKHERLDIWREIKELQATRPYRLHRRSRLTPYGRPIRDASEMEAREYPYPVDDDLRDE